MALRDPQYDNRIRGGADIWDQGLAGALLQADYFPTAAPPSGSAELIVTPATYLLTGTSAITLWRRRAEVTPGSYGITEQAATTLWGRAVNTTAAAYAITGSPVELIYTPITPALVLDVTPGAYVLTGSDAGVRWGQRVDVTPAAFAISGQTVTVRRTYRADVLPGAYTISGAAATLGGPGDLAPAVTGDYQMIQRRRRR